MEALGDSQLTKKTKSVHYSTLQNHPISLAFVGNVRNKINLVASVPSYMPLESDSIKSNLLYRTPAMKRARSATRTPAKKPSSTASKAQKSITNCPEEDSAQLYGLHLTAREVEHLAELRHSTIFIETKSELTSFDMVETLREHGYIRVVKEHETGFWCSFSDITNEESIVKLVATLKKKHGKLFSSVCSHKDVSTYYLANQKQ